MPPEFARLEGVSPPRFQPLGFASFVHNNRLLPTYPTGFPLHLAAAGRIFGWSWGPRLVEVLGALAGVWLCYAVGREVGLGRALAAAGAVTLAVCPVMVFASIQPLSDTLAMTWCLAAVWMALRTRFHPGWAVACGAAYGVAVLVRPTNILLLPALLMLLGFNWRRLALAALGGLPCVAWLAFYNHALYGGAFRSGYFNWSEFFALRYFTPAVSYFVRWLAVFLPAVLLVLPVAAFWRRDTRTRELYALACWFVPITGLYLFVAFSHEAWTCLRYILPALPALILAAMLGVEAIARSCVISLAPHLRYGAAVLVAGWAVGMSWYWSRQSALFLIKGYEDAYATASTAARTHFPANTLMLSCHLSGALFYYTDFPVLRWDAITPDEFTKYAALAQRAGVTVGALLFADEEQRALRELCPGEWTRLATVDNVGIWRLAPSARGGEVK
ncbi:MAG: ArnT family glycosyltransferase [Opitutaceae bacterium]